jgi:hypothetical protein
MGFCCARNPSYTWNNADSSAFFASINQWGPGDIAFRFPFWFPVVITMALAAAPWLRWRFSLRTLLVATTLVAVGMGFDRAVGPTLDAVT